MFLIGIYNEKDGYSSIKTDDEIEAYELGLLYLRKGFAVKISKI